jgi:uracil-DNA glycosylase
MATRRRPATAREIPLDIDAAREQARDCTACDLYKNATQTVFGEGPRDAQIVVVGEQPGDQEDLAGHPFVGPAGRMLDRALADAGIDRTRVYVTNAVKHFKNEPRGKRRLHKKPSDAEIDACHPWLEHELAGIAPALVIALGATAIRGLLGKAMPILANRGKVIDFKDELVPPMRILITVHPSMILRVPPEDRDAAYAQFVADLKVAAKLARKEGWPGTLDE